MVSIETARLVVSTLVAAGVKQVAYCPGSRNAPFAYVLSAYEDAGVLSVATLAEERGAGFWAVGALQGECGARPVAVFTTSGTAAVELHPALVEAAHQGLPLIAVTADRPWELRGVGANQTTNQVGLFGGSVVAEVDIPAFEGPLSGSDTAARAIEGRVTRMIARALGHGGRPGPVHLNVSFRDPLVPQGAPGELRVDAGYDPTSVLAATPLPAQSDLVPVSWSEAVRPGLQTLIVAGDGSGQCSGSSNRRVAQYAATLGVPLLAEPSSGLCDLPNWLPHGPLIADALAKRVEQIVVLGHPTLSRPVDRLLATADVRKVVVSDSHEWPDTQHTSDCVVARLIPDSRDTVVTGEFRASSAWVDYCESASRIARSGLSQSTLNHPGAALNHLTAAQAIWHESHDVSLWLGASNVIRSFDMASSAPGNRWVYANRGLAGIDGTVASALGLAAGGKRPIRVVLGDLTFCYDLASLPARPFGNGTGREDEEEDIQIIVFDDGGGSIFASLEHGAAADENTYRKYFGVPQTVDVCAIAEACGWRSREVNSLTALERVLREPVRGRSVIRVPLTHRDHISGRNVHPGA